MEELVYRLVLENKKDGVLQSVVWKELGLNSRDGSRTVSRLERMGMIRRVRVMSDGRWTYKLTSTRRRLAIYSRSPVQRPLVPPYATPAPPSATSPHTAAGDEP